MLKGLGIWEIDSEWEICEIWNIKFFLFLNDFFLF